MARGAVGKGSRVEPRKQLAGWGRGGAWAGGAESFILMSDEGSPRGGLWAGQGSKIGRYAWTEGGGDPGH